MTITITENEYNAVAFAITQVENEIEGACDDDFIKDANRSINALYRIMDKYKKSKYKSRLKKK